MAGLDLQGGLTLALHAAMEGDATTIGVDGTIGVTGGMQQIRDLIGEDGQLTLAATLHGRDLTLSRLRFDGRSLTASASGSVVNDQIDLTWSLGVSDLAAAEPTLSGQLQANGHVAGTTDDLDLTADLTAASRLAACRPAHSRRGSRRTACRTMRTRGSPRKARCSTRRSISRWRCGSRRRAGDRHRAGGLEERCTQRAP